MLAKDNNFVKSYFIKDSFKNKLQKGDIILYHGHHWLSEIIQNLDNSYYNHCAIYDEFKDGKHYIYEASNNGIKHRSLEESISDSKSSTIAIYRLTDPPENMQKVVKNIQALSQKKTKYSLSQLLLLAGILLTKKVTHNYSLFSFTHNFLLYTVDKFEKITDSENNKLVCSELVYRAYNEIEDSNYRIHIDNQFSVREISVPLFKFDEKSRSTEFKHNANSIRCSLKSPQEKCNAFETLCIDSLEKAEYIVKKSTGIKVDERTKKVNKKGLRNSFKIYREETQIITLIKRLHKQTCNLEINADLNKRISELIDEASSVFKIDDDISKARKRNIEFFKTQNGDLYDSIFKDLEISNFITPGDIERAYNIEEIGQLHIPEFAKKSCDFCTN